MPVGITTFIAKGLAKGARFSTGGQVSAKKGLEIGRAVDLLVRRAVQGTRVPAGAFGAPRAQRFLDCVRRLDLVADAAQISGAIPALNLRTIIDVMARDRHGNAVVLELKTTQHTMAVHDRQYYKTCKNLATLTNGLPNCLYWRHQLQCGFGVMCTAASRGLVVVVCADGVRTYPVEPVATERSRFLGAMPVAADLHAPLLPWPVGNDAALRKTLARRGYTAVKSTHPPLVTGRHGDAVVLIIHKHRSYPRSRASRDHRTLARLLTLPRARTAGLFVWIGDTGNWRVQTVVKRTTRTSRINQ